MSHIYRKSIEIMKRFQNLTFVLLFVWISFFLINSCSPDDITINVETPVLSTINVNDLTASTAYCGGEIKSNGGALIINQGVCWSTNALPTIADNKSSDWPGDSKYVSYIVNLKANTTYYVRAYATNSDKTGYGNVISFTTPAVTNVLDSKINFNPEIIYGSMTDQEGNGYRTVKIGSRTWMAENLRTTKYNDGTTIPMITGNYEWFATSTGAYCIYNNSLSTDSIAIFGRLYNWLAVNTGKLAPKGWHVATAEEWYEFVNINATEVKLTETGTSHWPSPNTKATNATGFTALPGGERSMHGTFRGIGFSSCWWSSTEYSNTSAWYRSIDYLLDDTYGKIYNHDGDKHKGYYIRCVKD